MKTINDPESLIEVWEWKNLVYNKNKKYKNKTQQIHKSTETIIKNLGLKKLVITNKAG